MPSQRSIAGAFAVALSTACAPPPAGSSTDGAGTMTTTDTSGGATTGATTGGSPTTTGGGTTAPGEQSGEFLALTYNVAGLPDVLSDSEPAINTPYISPLLNDYDLVLVQEDWLTPDPNPTELVVYHDLLAAQALHPYQSVPLACPFGTDPGRPQAMLSDGLNRFSQFEFGALTRVRWDGCFGGFDTSDGGAADCLALKGFSVATHVLAPGVEVDVYNLHGEAGNTEQDQMLSAADFQQLATFVNEHSAGRAIILGGDTNLHNDPGHPDEATWDGLQAATGLVDVCAVVDCGADATIIDKFAFRSSDALTIEPLSHHFEREKFVRPDDQAPLSDHDALAVRFRWTWQG